jgi:hypothetical protein
MALRVRREPHLYSKSAVAWAERVLADAQGVPEAAPTASV